MSEPKLILLRHGKSAWNAKNLFTGWVDVPLNHEGVQEALKAGEKIKDLPIDVIFTSTLIRAHMTLGLSMLHHSSNKVPIFTHTDGSQKETWGQIHGERAKKESIPVYMAPELNERMYGNLQGLNKKETAEKYGADQVHTWRRSFRTRPPEGESLEMTAARTLPYFEEKIIPYLDQGKSVFVCAHGNSLRSIMMELDQLSEDQVVNLEIATGLPIIYRYHKKTWIKESFD